VDELRVGELNMGRGGGSLTVQHCEKQQMLSTFSCLIYLFIYYLFIFF